MNDRSPPTPTQIEAAARAMCERDGFSWDAESIHETANGEDPEQQREYWRDKAEAALSAALSVPAAAVVGEPVAWEMVPKIGAMVKANHPITCLNPEEWFAVTEIEHRHGKFYVRGENTCWFSVSSLLHISWNVQP